MSDTTTPSVPEPPRERRRLNLKPRDEAAAAKAAMERNSGKQSVFGDAKPREVSLAGRSGKSEEEILREELAKDKIQLRLTPDQIQEKRAAEADIAEAQSSLDEAEEGQTEAAAAELKSRQQKLEQLMHDFQEMALQRAKSGEGVRPSERRRLAEEAAAMQGGQPPYQGGQSFGGRGGRQPYAGGRGGFQGRDEGFAGSPPQGNWSRGGPAPAGSFNGHGGDVQQADSYGSFGGGGGPPGGAFGGYNSGGRGGRGGPRGGRGRGPSGEAQDFAFDNSAGGLPGMDGDYEPTAAGPTSRQDRF
ncbi:hypothetical protein WJX74_008184 [Apatococcus lobatus]|uniref:Uncharacterized protein n=1 Tax=Apatococcus lobatus TaxID=904363 RepID=A0AAW1S7H8_9CHLO